MSDNDDTDFECEEEYLENLASNEYISKQIDFLWAIREYLKDIGLSGRLLNNLKEVDMKNFLDGFLL